MNKTMITVIKSKTTAIMIILNLITLLCIGMVQAETGLDFNVPQPLEAKLVDTKEFSLGGREIRASLYMSQKGQFELLKYYQDFFKDNGFVDIMDKQDVSTDRRMLRFKKDDLVVGVSLLPQADQTQVAISKYLEPRGSPSLEELKPSVKDSLATLPQEDAPGEDLGIIPRPPESIRWQSYNQGSQSLLTYATKLSVDEVREFYKTEMAEEGWQMQGETATAETMKAYKKTTGKTDFEKLPSPFSDGEDLSQVLQQSFALDFKGTDGSARITVFPNFMERGLGSVVNIRYTEIK